MKPDIDPTDLQKISNLILRLYGFDFSNYAASSFSRRISRILDLKKLTIANLLTRLEREPEFVLEFLAELTVSVTEMFRDPAFWIALREEIIPALQKVKTHFTIWHSGCSSGEEVWSMQILLHEMGISGNVEILATDLDLRTLQKARLGLCSEKHLNSHRPNYVAFKGTNLLENYFKVSQGIATFQTKNMTPVRFEHHDLVRGALPGQFDLIVCRNVMIYFNQSLQNSVLEKFRQCLLPKGYLAIGSKESLTWCDAASNFQLPNDIQKIYQKVG